MKDKNNELEIEIIDVTNDEPEIIDFSEFEEKDGKGNEDVNASNGDSILHS